MIKTKLSFLNVAMNSYYNKPVVYQSALSSMVTPVTHVSVWQVLVYEVTVPSVYQLGVPFWL